MIIILQKIIYFRRRWFVTNELPTEKTAPTNTNIFELQNKTDSGLLVTKQKRSTFFFIFGITNETHLLL